MRSKLSFLASVEISEIIEKEILFEQKIQRAWRKRFARCCETVFLFYISVKFKRKNTFEKKRASSVAKIPELS